MWLRASAYGLSERERAVVDLVVQGACTKEISRALYISEYTVQDHLSNVFDKVGVRSHRALIKRLFFDYLYPTLFAQTVRIDRTHETPSRSRLLGSVPSCPERGPVQVGPVRYQVRVNGNASA